MRSHLRDIIAVLLFCLPPASSVHADLAFGRQGMVATVQPLATEAGVRAFRRGGNAVDAAVAAAVTLGVVDGHNSGLGGGCFILLRRPSGALVAIDGREMAPAAATRDMFLRDGQADPLLSQLGPLAVGVPGALAAYESAVATHGRLPLAASLEHAAGIAERGFSIDRVYAANLLASVSSLAMFPASREMFLTPDGAPYPEGHVLQLPDLATSYRQIARHGSDWFYRGEFARRVAAWMRDNGGLLTAEDFAGYQVKQRQPIISTYRGHQIVGFPPPSSGGVHVAQILNILAHFDLQRLLRDEPVTGYHIVAEAMQLAFADRAHWLGDADFAFVPRGLIAEDYAKQLARRIDLTRPVAVPSHGLPPNWRTDLFGKHTTHIAAADAEGNWVAITATVNTSFGSKVVVPGTGVVLNNEMDDFSAQPGMPNAFGLVGAEANAVAPRKRPLSSMSPTIVLKDGKPVLTVGAAGGPKIITQAVLCIINYLDTGLPLEQCVAQARLHHQWRPERLFVEETFDTNLVDAFCAMGHQLDRLSTAGITQAIAIGADGSFIGVADPRVPGKASGF